MNNKENAQRLLYFTYGLLPIVAGADKFFNYIVNWAKYLNPMIPEYLHTSPVTVNHGVGVIEILAGLLVLWKPQIGGKVVALWHVLIAINLVTIHYYDIAIRDLAMAVGAYALALLS